MSSTTQLHQSDELESSDLPVHPWTGQRAVGVLPSGRIVWPIRGGSEPIDDGDDGDDGDGDDDGGDDDGQQQQAPAFTPITSQEDLEKILGRKVKQIERRYKGFDDIKAKADQYDTLVAATQTDQERAVAEAEEAAWNAAMSKAVPRVVKAEFKAQATAAGLSRDQLDALLEDLDLTRYADDDGDPDEKKIARKLAALTPSGKGGGGTPDFGQGRRGSQGKVNDMNGAIRKLAGL